jgi:hypothetical protein
MVSGTVIALVTLAVYWPGLKIQFLDGWWYLEWVGTMDFPRYVIQFLDPANITQGYRPVQGLFVLVQYLLFRFNPDGYNMAHILLHAGNSILLFLIVSRLGGRARVALLSALIYAVLPAYNLAVFWHAVVDPLSAFFYLSTILVWIFYQETRRPLLWAATLGVYLFALFSKEVAVFLPILLFFIERWFFNRKPDIRVLAWQYTPFILVLFPYALLELNVHSHGEFVGQFGFKIGPHMLSNLLPYLSVMTFPWISDLPSAPIYYIWMAIAVLVYAAIMTYKKSTVMLFLGAVAVFNIAPLLGFPLDYFNTRYLYTSLMVSAILIAAMVEIGWQRLKNRRGFAAAVLALAITAVVLISGAQVSEAASGLAEFTRQLRVPFRDISRRHPEFPPDSYLYFVYSPNTRVVDFEGLFFVRYGTAVSVGGTDVNTPVNLSKHNATFVYYFDTDGRPVELPVEKRIQTGATPSLPINFSEPLTLHSYQVPSASLARGKALVVLLDWSSTAPIDKDYALFAHLVNSKGDIISGFDGQPRRGEAPTSKWFPGRPVVDAVVIPIDRDAPLGSNYHVELGMYDPASMQRLSIMDSNGQSIGDALSIGPFSIIAQE